MVYIEINGKKLAVNQGTMIIEAADEAGIRIPRFCYHKKLSIAANCRMCLVEVDKARKPMPACATPVTDGMKIYTKSSMALEAQRVVMEFLLINHPLDCPICDQGGECELQDIALVHGSDVSRYNEGKRVVKDKDIGPLVSTDMTRCIHCTRCVRFGSEIAGVRDLGAIGRGESTSITTYIEQSMSSELSGNVIDLCPVGALNSKPFRFSARTWELLEKKTIAPHDCVGSNLNVHLKDGQVKRIVPDDNENINENWLSDRDRFSYEALYSDDRLQSPMVKNDGQWQAIDWDQALATFASELRKIAGQYGTDQIGALVSPSATLEEQFLMQRIMRGMGSNNVDHRLREVDFSDQYQRDLFPSLGVSIAQLETTDTILLIGSNIRKDQPIACHRVRKAVANGARVLVINPIDFDFNFAISEQHIAAGGDLVSPLAELAQQISSLAHSGARAELSAVQKMAEYLKFCERGLLLLGPLALHHPHAAQLRALAHIIANSCNASVGELSEGANSAGAWLAGAVPHREAAGSMLSQPGLAADQMIAAQLRSYILLGVEPEYDCAHSAKALAAMTNAELVVAITSHDSPAIRDYASLILPRAIFTENTGTLVNAGGVWQSFSAVSKAVGESKEAWKILRVLGNLLHLENFTYVNSEQIRDEIKNKLAVMPKREQANWQFASPGKSLSNGECIRIAQTPIYAGDSLVRRAVSLQQTTDAQELAVLRINASGAEKFSLTEGGFARVSQDSSDEVVLTVVIDDRVPDNTVLLPAALAQCVGLGVAYDQINIKQA